MKKRIVFTGGSGKIGRHAIPYLVERGYEVLNVDRVALDHPGVPTVITDLADSGQTFNALSMYFGLDDMRAGHGVRPVDAVVHFAAIPRITLVPDNTMFAANVMATYNVMEAATKLGIRKIVYASSETTYGICFADGERPFTSFPLDEDSDVDPPDSYGLSKVVGEKIARSFATRSGADVYALRIGGVVEPHDYQRFAGFLADPKKRRRDAWTYTDVRDLAEIIRLSIETDGLGYQVFNAVNDEIIADEPTSDFLRRHAPEAQLRRALDEHEGPMPNRKARDLLGFRQSHSWRDYDVGSG
jgi:nucleoside-diphosphate-sugar epimerase